MQESLQKEIRLAVVLSIVFDLLIWFVSVWFSGFGLAVPLGLAVGTAAMLGNLLLLRNMVQMAVYHGKTRCFGSYLLRCAVASTAIALGLIFDQIHALAVILPFLYQRIIIGIIAVRTTNGGR